MYKRPTQQNDNENQNEGQPKDNTVQEFRPSTPPHPILDVLKDSPKKNQAKRTKLQDEAILALLAHITEKISAGDYEETVRAFNTLLIHHMGTLSYTPPYIMTLINLYKHFAKSIIFHNQDPNGPALQKIYKQLLILPTFFQIAQTEDFFEIYNENEKFLLCKQFETELMQARNNKDKNLYLQATNTFIQYMKVHAKEIIPLQMIRDYYVELSVRMTDRVDLLIALQQFANLKITREKENPFYMAQYYYTQYYINGNTSYLFSYLKELKKQMEYYGELHNPYEEPCRLPAHIPYHLHRKLASVNIHNAIKVIEKYAEPDGDKKISVELSLIKEDLTDSLTFGHIDDDQRTFDDWIYLDYKEYNARTWPLFIEKCNAANMLEMSKDKLEFLNTIVFDSHVKDEYKTKIREKLSALYAARYNECSNQKNNAKDEQEKINILEATAQEMRKDHVSPRDVYYSRLIALDMQLFALYKRKSEDMSIKLEALLAHVEEMLASKQEMDPETIQSLQKAKDLFAQTPVTFKLTWDGDEDQDKEANADNNHTIHFTDDSKSTIALNQNNSSNESVPGLKLN